MSFPPPITAMKLVVSTGTSPNVQTFEQTILPSELSGTTANSVLINDSLLNAFSSQSVGTSFSSSIVTTYDGFPSSNTLSSNSTSNFIPRVLSLANISNKLTTDSPFSLSGLISTVSTGNLSYSSSNQSVSTVSPTGLVTIVGEGTTTITVNQVADATYGAASASKTFAVATPPTISLAANGLTIRYTGLVSAVPSSTPLFKYENPRGRVTGPEWFAVINQDSTPNINAYAKSNSSSFFTPPGETTPVIYDNIVTSLITNMSALFYEVGAYGEVLGVFTHNISSWDTSNVTNMSRAFLESMFNSEINDWDVSNVTDMALLFRDNASFNKPLNKWNTSKVTNMKHMFKNTSFNQDISSWDTSKVTNMIDMFNYAYAFNRPLNSWNVSEVTNMSNMFSAAQLFNQPLDRWNVSKVTDMNYMFNSATAFNQNISSWQVYNLTSKPNKPALFDNNSALLATNLPNWAMDAPTISLAANSVTIRYTGLVSAVPSSTPLFKYENPRGLVTGPEWFAVVDNSAKPYITSYAKNETMGINYFKPLGQSQPVPLNNIVTTNMTDMSYMFSNATTFNQDISSWDTSNVINMLWMFYRANAFNKPIGSWDTSNVTDMNNMFGQCYAFNQPIGLWNTSNVTTMAYMFMNTYFNQDISQWNTSKVIYMTNMFFGAAAFNQNISSWKVYNLTSKPNKPNDFGATALLASHFPNWAMPSP